MYKVCHPQKQFTAYDPTRPLHFTLRNSPKEFTSLIAAIAPKSSAHPEQRLYAFYQWVDAVMLELRQSSVCEQGCAHCCKQPVSVTSIEIELAKFSPSFGRAPEFDPVTQYCPFLNQETAQCSIYAFRPLACRAFLALDDPKYCETADSHYTFTMDHLSEKLSELLATGPALDELLMGEINKLFSGERTDFRVSNRRSELS